MAIIYNTFLILLFIPTLFFLLIKYKKQFIYDFINHWRDRLANWNFHVQDNLNNNILIHCASLGEVRMVESLIKKLRPYNIILSTQTSSGYNYAKRNNIADSVFFAPIDFTFLIDKIFDSIKPKLLILTETELWPGMLYCSKRRGIKTILINARLSEKSFFYYKATRFIWKRLLQSIDIIVARSVDDANRFEIIGVPRDKIIITGNIKYDTTTPCFDFERKHIGLNDSNFVIVAGSTREDEERILIQVFSDLKRDYPNIKLIIAPRHLNRLNLILKYLKKNLISFKLYSDKSYRDYDCLIVDTFGDLQKFYYIADVAFVGGSIVKKRGQNPIEPAAFKKPVLFGKYMDNFKTEASFLISEGGAILVNDVYDLKAKIEYLIINPLERSKIGEKAFLAVEKQKGSTDKVKDIILRILNKY